MKNSSDSREMGLWLFVVVVAVLELSLFFALPHFSPSKNDWHDAGNYLQRTKTESDLLLFSPGWRRQLLQKIKVRISPREFGGFDVSTYRKVFELSDGTTSPLVAELQLKKESHFGNVIVREYENPEPAHVHFDFTAQSERPPRFLIDGELHQRLALSVPVENTPLEKMSNERKTYVLSYSDVPLLGEIYGYGFVSKIDFRNEQYENDGPVELKVYLDGKLLGTKIFHWKEPLFPFRFPTNCDGVGQIEFHFRAIGPFSHYGFAFAADMRSWPNNDR